MVEVWDSSRTSWNPWPAKNALQVTSSERPNWKYVADLFWPV